MKCIRCGNKIPSLDDYQGVICGCKEPLLENDDTEARQQQLLATLSQAQSRFRR